MNLGLAGLTFALVIPAELPDKTFLSAVVLSSRHRPLPVWLGAAAGLILQAGIAVVAGRFIALLPHREVQGVVATLFLGGAGYLIFVPERKREAEGDELAQRTDKGLARQAERWWRMSATTFVVITLAEFGDLTQILIANLTARYRDPLSVFLGAAVAFVLVSGAGVTFGRALTRLVPLGVVRLCSGLALAALGIYTLASVA